MARNPNYVVTDDNIYIYIYIYTAIGTALKVACKARILGKSRPLSVPFLFRASGNLTVKQAGLRGTKSTINNSIILLDKT